MQVTLSAAQVISRILAVLLLAVPVVLISGVLDGYEQEAIAKLSHKELLEYLKEDQSFAAGYFTTSLLTLVYVGMVEAVAFGLRLAMKLFQGSEFPKPVHVPAR